MSNAMLDNRRMLERNLIQSRIESNDPIAERTRLEARYGKGDVFDTEELKQKFKVYQFLAPFVIVEEIATKKAGSLKFQHEPRFYFDFRYENGDKPNAPIKPKPNTMGALLGIKNQDDIDRLAELMADKITKTE